MAGDLTDQPYEALVIGGGVNGLASLYHLLRLGCRRVALIERFSLGHERGSSHGFSRVIRSAYIHAGYVRLVQAALREEWPRLEGEAGMRLIHHTPGCFFGPAGGKWEQYARATAEAGLEGEVLDPAEARRRFPLFRFEGAGGVLEDRTAGLVAARDTMSALVRLCRERGGHFLELTRVTSIEPGPELIPLIWRLLMVAETRFRKLNAYELLQDVYEGKKYNDGKPIEQTQPPTEVPLKEAA